jgi:hypothetical protein
MCAEPISYTLVAVERHRIEGRVEIPMHLNRVKSEMKGMKLDLPTFRRPKRSFNAYRTSRTMCLFRSMR